MGPGKFLENSRNSTGKVLEKSLRFVTKKGYEPCSSTIQWSAPFMFPCTGCYHFVTCLSEKNEQANNYVNKTCLLFYHSQNLLLTHR